MAPGKGLSEEGGERPAQSEAARQQLFSFAVCQVPSWCGAPCCLGLGFRFCYSVVQHVVSSSYEVSVVCIVLFRHLMRCLRGVPCCCHCGICLSSLRSCGYRSTANRSCSVVRSVRGFREGRARVCCASLELRSTPGMALALPPLFLSSRASSASLHASLHELC